MIHIDSQNVAKPLKPGDEVITTAISSVFKDDEKLLKGLKVFESWGLVCRNKSINKHKWGYLAGRDSTRYSELYPKNSAPLIAFACGGWGAARLLEFPQLWKPGWLLGYSDLTAILLARLASGFNGGIHGPLVTSLGDEPSWSQNRLHSILFGHSVPDLYGEGWNKGLASGPLVVANLTVGSHLIGSNYFPDLNGAILILEDIGEYPYRIDRMLTQWRLAGILQKLAGIGFGNFEDCNAPIDEQIDQTFQLEEVLKERSIDLGIPVIGKLPIGHCSGNAALPLGHQALIDGTKGILRLLP